jgi:hypothetical protein
MLYDRCSYCRTRWSGRKVLHALAEGVPPWWISFWIALSHSLLTVSPLMIPLVCCHIKSFQRASSVEKPWPGGEKRRDGRASPPEALGGEWVVSPRVCATGLSLIARGCLIGATPRGQPWTSAGTLPHRRNGRRARRRAVWYTFREPSRCRHVHRALMRSAWRDLTPIILATVCHQRNYVERYSRFRIMLVPRQHAKRAGRLGKLSRESSAQKVSKKTRRIWRLGGAFLLPR